MLFSLIYRSWKEHLLNREFYKNNHFYMLLNPAAAEFFNISFLKNRI